MKLPNYKSEQHPKAWQGLEPSDIKTNTNDQVSEAKMRDVSLQCEITADSKKLFGNEASRGFSFDYLRYVVVIMSGVAVGAMLFARHAFTTAIVSMVNHTALYELEHPNSSAKEFFREDYVEVGQFVWSNEIQQIILSGYMISYTLPQFFTTRFAMNRGLKLSIPVSLTICSVSLLLTPLASHWGWQCVLLLRLVNGLGASPLLPIMINAIENWMPKSETTSGVAIAQFSCNLVYGATPLVSGYLASKHWKWTFYAPASVMLVFCIIWYSIVADNPKSSKLISRRELEKVVGSTSFQHKQQESIANADNEDKQTPEQDPVAGSEYPWYFMFRLRQFYPLVVCWVLQCCTSSGFVFLMPAYLTRILELPVDQIGYINFISQIGCTVCMLWSGPVTHIIQTSFNLSLTAARDVVVVLCSIVVVTTFLFLGLTHSHLVIMIALNRFFLITNETLFTATVMDQYSHIGLSCLIFSMCNTIGNFSTVFFSWTAGKVLDSFGDSIECWTALLLVFGCLNGLFALVYICFCDSRPVYITDVDKDAQKEGTA